MKKILIALDYFSTAQQIADDGFALAKSMNAEVVLLHVVTDPVYYSSTAYSPIMGFGSYSDIDLMQMAIDDGLKKASQDFLDDTKNHLNSVSIETMVEEGDVADSILESAKKIKADLIVMGSHSRKWLEEVIMGSVTAKVLHHTTIPVYIIPTKKQNKK